tara:strand:- start:376 stop:555 length:180 start_codon:yes stop_codon:yes gene_type:complete
MRKEYFFFHGSNVMEKGEVGSREWVIGICLFLCCQAEVLEAPFFNLLPTTKTNFEFIKF